jgi:hypothetical protein
MKMFSQFCEPDANFVMEITGECVEEHGHGRSCGGIITPHVRWIRFSWGPSKCLPFRVVFHFARSHLLVYTRSRF